MRAIAILVIVAYHAGVPGFSGGFIGVDIFFVISGFLITRNLLDESIASNSIRLSNFWARRVRRLVPGLALMVVVTLVFSSVIVAPFDMLQISKEGASAALYISNIVFGFKAQNYFATNINKSPFLHTWSLGVEEQFYLVWPFVLYGALILSRGSRMMLRRVALPIFLIILAISFALNISWTASGSAWAFFSLPSRAWEFAIGGLIASISIRKGPMRWSVATGLIGLACLGYADLFFTDTTSYPGVHAVWPVAGTGLLIVSGQMVGSANPTMVMRVMSARPMRWIGRLSYSWYLWHWPFIILAVLAVGNSGVPIRVIAALASLGVASLAFRVVENPVRLSQQLIRSAGRTFLVGVSITVVTLGAAWGTWLLASRSTPTSFTIAKDAAFKDFFPLCVARSSPRGIPYCEGGDLKSSTTVALVGDSHAQTWFNELSSIAAKQHVHLVKYAWPGCPFIPIVVRPLPDGPVSTERCLALRAQGMRLMAELKPKAIILSQHDGAYFGSILDKSGSVPARDAQVALWKKAFEAFLNQMQGMGIRPAVILDNPTLPYEPAECVSRTQSIAACEPTKEASLATAKALMSADRAVLSRYGSTIPVFAPDDVLCNQAGCPLELHGRLVYADTNHLLFGAIQLMEPQLSNLLRSVLNGA